jgi:hypothetical protein
MQKYTTEDYGLANWLLFKGVEFLGAVAYPDNPRKSFFFIKPDNLEELTDEWFNPTTEEAKICKKFFKAHTIIKKELRDSYDAGSVFVS